MDPRIEQLIKSQLRPARSARKTTLVAQPLVDHEYQAARVFEYPTLADQLDTLWHDIEAGKFGAKARTSEFFQAIKAVKDRHPKP